MGRRKGGLPGADVDLALVRQTGLVYPVVAFTAEVTAWSFDAPPPTGLQRHYVKAAASPGHERFEVSIDLRMAQRETIDLHWVGIGALHARHVMAFS